MSFSFFKSSENDSSTPFYDQASAYDAEKTADSFRDDDELPFERDFGQPSDGSGRRSGSGKRPHDPGHPDSVFQWISGRTLLGAGAALIILTLCGCAAAWILMPIYRNGTEAEQKIAAENAAYSEELSAKLQEISQTLESINQMGVLTAQAASVPDSTDSRLLYAVPAPSSSGAPDTASAEDSDLLTEENFRTVRAELETAEETLKSFENDLSRYRSEQSAIGNEAAPQLDHLIAELSAAKENVHTLQDRTAAQLEQFRTDEGRSNEHMIQMMNDLLDERTMISSDIRELRAELEDLIAEMERSGTDQNEALADILNRQSETLSSMLQNSVLSSFSRLENSLSAIQAQINNDLAAQQSQLAIQQSQLAAQEAAQEALHNDLLDELPGMLEMKTSALTDRLDGLDTSASETVRMISLMLEEQEKQSEQYREDLARSAERFDTGINLLNMQLQELSEQIKALSGEEDDPETPVDPVPVETGENTKPGSL